MLPGFYLFGSAFNWIDVMELQLFHELFRVQRDLSYASLICNC